MKKITVFLILAFILTVGLISCSSVKFDINFVVDGEQYDKISTAGNEFISMPANPQKENYTFKGWYWDEGVWQQPFTANSLLNVPLSSNLTIYARFEANDVDTVTVKFNTMGGSSIETQNIKKGAQATEPDVPTYDGYYFCGWYTYPDYATMFSFEQAVTSNTTLYAKWAQTSDNVLAVNDFEDIVKVEQDNSFYGIFRDEETGRNYVVYKLGVMKNVIMGRVTNQFFYNSGGSTLTWDKVEGMEKSVSESIELSLSVALTASLNVETGMSFEGSSTSISTGFSATFEQSFAHSYGRTYSIMSQASEGGSQSLDGFEKGRYYDMFIVGNQNVYQYFTFDAGGRLLDTAVTAAEISSGLMPLSSTLESSFVYEDIPSLTPLSEPDFSMVFDSGNGTSEAPYGIKTAEQLFAVGLCPDADYKLLQDIDLEKFKKWMPIGASEEYAFSGTFDGCGFAIKNLSLKYNGEKLEQEKIYGLFGYVTGQIKNLSLSNINFSVLANHSGNGWLHVGALCAKLKGTVSNVEAYSCVVGAEREKSHCGIIAGHTTGIIKNTKVNNSTINSQGDGGLIVGCMSNAVVEKNSVSDCTLSYYATYNDRCNGGIGGYAENSTVKDCTVENTKFALAGSADNMHNYPVEFNKNWHSGCELSPLMGYILGYGKGCTLNADSHQVSGNSKYINDKDRSLVGDTSKSESTYWFRVNNGKFGRVE